MEKLNYKLENSTLTLYPEGHVDSANAPELEREIAAIREANPTGAVVVDCEKL